MWLVAVARVLVEVPGVGGRARAWPVWPEPLLDRLVGFGQSCWNLSCCGWRGSGRSACSRGLVVAFAAGLHIIRLNVLFLGCG